MFFVIRRNASLSRILTIWAREIAKYEKVDKKLMVHFAGEDGIDDGALSSVFLTNSIDKISTDVFPDGAPVDSMLLVQNGHFKFCGQIVGYSLTHNGPPPCFMDQNVFKLLLDSDVDKEKLDVDIHGTSKDKELFKCICEDPNNFTDTILEHGYTGVINQINIDAITKTLLVSIVTRRLCYLSEFKKGLDVFGVSTYMKSFPELFGQLFDINNDEFKKVDGTFIASTLRPTHSEEESIRYEVEVMIVDLFEDFLYEIDAKDVETVSVSVAVSDNRVEDEE